MALANQEAQRFNHEYIGTEHILLGLVKEGSGVGANVLKKPRCRSPQGATGSGKSLSNPDPKWSTMGQNFHRPPRAKKGHRIRY